MEFSDSSPTTILLLLNKFGLHLLAVDDFYPLEWGSECENLVHCHFPHLEAAASRGTHPGCHGPVKVAAMVPVMVPHFHHPIF